MHMGGKFLATAAVLACTACLGEAGKLEIRSVDRGFKNGDQPVPYRIAESRAHLALGNVALALEGFRKAHREDPASVEALAGMADCYQRMGRFDLSRRNYEMALAIAPRDPGLLNAFAASLDQRGEVAEAASVRREALAAAATAQSEIAPESTAAEVKVAEAEPSSLIPDQSLIDTDVAQGASPATRPVETAETSIGQLGSSVTVALAPPKPAQAAVSKQASPQERNLASLGPSVTIALKPVRPAPKALPAQNRQPRLERLSLSEVALITGSGPRWSRPQATTTRLAIESARQYRGGLRVLNAARVEKLAARTRSYLGHFGWRNVTVGDAVSTRARSLIVYPLAARTEARRLSARLGFATAARQDVRQVTVLLGRDAAMHPELRTKG